MQEAFQPEPYLPHPYMFPPYFFYFPNCPQWEEKESEF